MALLEDACCSSSWTTSSSYSTDRLSWKQLLLRRRHRRHSTTDDAEKEFNWLTGPFHSIAMPRSFMITNRRYRTAVDYDSAECSPEPSDIFHPLCNSSSSLSPTEEHKSVSMGGSIGPPPFDFYNRFQRLSGLEQLAEISLATAHRWNPSPPSSPETDNSSSSSAYSDSSLSSLTINTSDANTNIRLFHHHHHRHRRHHPHRTKYVVDDEEEVEEVEEEEEEEDEDDQPLALVTKIKETLVEKSVDKDEKVEEGRHHRAGKKCLTSPEVKNGGGGGGSLSGSNMCPECGKRYSTSSNLARHRQTHRSMEDKKARKCPHCDKVYVSMPAYSMHVRTHNQGCQCPFCGKCYSRPWLLQGHIRTHTGEKPFKCQVCNKAFADKSNLRAHVQTHSDTKPFVCQRCGKAFALKSYLYKHEESSCMRAHATSANSSPLNTSFNEHQQAHAQLHQR